MHPRVLAVLAATGLGACVSQPLPMVEGPAVTTVTTPYGAALSCLGKYVPDTKYVVGVAAIADKTGKFSLDDGGFKVTQGPDLMVVSALAKTNAVSLVERLDTRILEWELNYANDKVLGDGPRVVNTPEGQQQVNYRGIFPGVLVGSDYYIIGGVTSLDYNISSGGLEASISGIGGGYREFRLLVGIDLRLVDTRTSRIVATSSQQKQILGFETEAGVFRFFDDILVDINAGAKVNEPMGLGVRAVIERAVFDLVTQLYGLPYGECHELVQRKDAPVEAG
jgi:curli biogenesis system outer membrane secretion channel CsgG